MHNLFFSLNWFLFTQMNNNILNQETQNFSERKLDWTVIKSEMKNRFGKDIFESWIKKIEFVNEFNDYVLISVSTRFIRDWITSRYLDQILQIIKSHKKNVNRIEFTIREIKDHKIYQAQNGQGQSSDETIRYFGEFSLDLASHRLSHGDVSVPLTSGEFDLLSVLVEHPNKVMDRDRILDLLTGAERLPFDRSIDVRVTRLRSKIEADPSKPIHIRTIWGKGYMCCPNPDGE